MMQTPNELLPDGLQIDLLWTNASPTSRFAPQTISLDLNNYKFVYIECKRTTDLSTYGINGLIRIGTNLIGCLIGRRGDSVIYRFVEQVTEQGVSFGPGNDGIGDNNAYAIPMFIYGVK